VYRVREWRKKHPDAARRRVSKTRAAPLKDLPAKAGENQGVSEKRRASPPEPLQDVVPQRLQDFIMRNPLIIGLIAHLFGCALQDDVEAEMRRLIMKGMKIYSNKSAAELARGSAFRLDPRVTPSPRRTVPASAQGKLRGSPLTPR
jgi:hypothetical protein